MSNKKLRFYIVFISILALISFMAVITYVFVLRNNSLNDLQTKEWNLFSAVETAKGLDIKIVGKNLLLLDNIIIEADSQENESTSVQYLNDGITNDNNARWSSENNWENNEHWVRIQFPHKTSIGSMRLYWERLNACNYSIEISEDGQTWKSIASFEKTPTLKCQDIVLDAPVETCHLRLHILDVIKNEEDGSLYYQNVSLMELEVYGEFEDSFVIKKPAIQNGYGRKLIHPTVPNGYRLTYLGCDYEQIIDKNGHIFDTLSETEVNIGYLLKRGEMAIELPALKTTVPASQEAVFHSLLPQGYSPMEWLAQEGTYQVKNSLQIFISDNALEQTAKLLQKDLQDKFDISSVICTETENDVLSYAQEGDIYIKLAKEHANESYMLFLGNRIPKVTQIEASSYAGLRFGCVSFMDLLSYDRTIGYGTVKDYPRYSNRGFGIDVGRRPISLDMLYSIIKEMSFHKMNTLQIHLNDNQIISLSEQHATVENVLNLYSGFRLESDITNEEGLNLTSSDFYYSKEEFRELIETAAYYGVSIVPEIDTPAHSLSIIKLFPDLGLQEDAFIADQLNLANERTFSVVTDIWDEYLLETEDKPSVFEQCHTLHVGMDEYYGNNLDFLNYLKRLCDHINEKAPQKNIQMWGSFSNMDIDYSDVSTDIQIQIWNTMWADPYEIYNAGFQIINSQNTCLYIIPGSGYDWLDLEYLNNEWQPNIFIDADKKWTIPTYSPQMLGATYMLWNDMIYIDKITISDDDIYERFKQPLSIISDKLWN